MTNAEIKKEIQDGGFQVIKKSWLIITIVSFFIGLGINIGISQTQLSSKVDEPQARKIAKEEVSYELKHFFSDSDGKVLKSQLDDLKEKMNKMDDKLDRILRQRN